VVKPQIKVEVEVNIQQPSVEVEASQSAQVPNEKIEKPVVQININADKPSVTITSASPQALYKFQDNNLIIKLLAI
jgi:hypothetical protein